MNIKLYTGNTEFPDFQPVTSTVDSQKPSVSQWGGNYDKVSLNKPFSPMDDMSFARVLARKTAAELEGGVSRERVLSLKHQIEAGTYHPNSRRIAEHILGYR